MKQSTLNPGIIYIIVGLFLLIIVGGSLILRLMGIGLALYFISHGLQMTGYPPLWILIPQLIADLHRKIFGRH
jgi:hypothetical protein